jgi:ABC-type branched-subunit amino acid transport system substrate-binding protein
LCPVCDHRFPSTGRCPTHGASLVPVVGDEAPIAISASSVYERAPSLRSRLLLVIGSAAALFCVGGGVGGLVRWAQRSARAPAIAPPALAAAALPPTPTSEPVIQGVTDDEVRVGLTAPFSGPMREYGRHVKLGLELAFTAANDVGGVHGRRMRLFSIDDGYDPAHTAIAVRELYDLQKVFAFVGNVGTGPAAMSLPFALERRMLFFGGFTGAGILRRDPPDRYVFNLRASYAEELAAIVRYLIKVRHVRPEQIAVFAQQDVFGDAGYAAIARTVRALHADSRAVVRVGYPRNTVDIADAVAQLRDRGAATRAVISVATYRPAARLIEKLRDARPKLIFAHGSYVDASALADELMLLGPRYADGVIVTQVVPSIDGYSTAVLKYKAALARYYANEKPDYLGFEGYLIGNLWIEALRRTGHALDSERLVETLEHLDGVDLGLGAPISFGPVEHQGSHRVWGTQLDSQGHYQEIDFE